ncbi:P-loop containing nucleoside triphosphate hydrolases superfamily protein [Raphanus sativus]|uniref:Kinesin-like protein KIN-14U isoform X1 n=3 Tax=Raphanus sativus TaxID=3726 RepID=A0A6J0NJJ8_RAPSA|nr:kinesin-like protein KIN-14U isoform X1 [Raphanus sativus]XP_018484730.1 kinesin-like protein KIN-14U isoform X1 [Raphanus sativus]KAJ4900700.1 P-loop containing nucleoside triphosphate hydrolases superfamily protein [Raphanus sativus]
MLISAEKEEILISQSPVSSMSVPESFESPQPVPLVYTDVTVVPEHERNELEKSISSLEGEVLELKSKLKSLDEKRREVLNKIIDTKGSIRVFCRVRPFLLTERRPIREPVSFGSDNVVVRSAGVRKEFEFDKVFHQSATQEDVFGEVKPILRSALDGHNVCVLAYGQTGTGKTFTMDGTNEQPGLAPRAIKELFNEASTDHAHSVTFTMSMLEIYMGNLKDLLSARQSLRSNEASAKCNLNIQVDSKGSVEIEGLTEVEVSDFAKARWWYNKGRRVRSTSWTNVNEASSRSHCLTRITIFRRGDGVGSKTEVSKLWMIDLGGSERLLKTGAIGQTLDEGRAINLSLSALGDVIAALRRKKGHVPYRNSKLTQILKDSLGTRSKVLMLVHISPRDEDVGETVCSLSFTKRARAVDSNRGLTEELRKLREKKILELEEEMRDTQERCKKIIMRLHEAECQLSDNKKLLQTTHEKYEEGIEERVLSPINHLKETDATPKSSDKHVKISKSSGNVPRFMTSTVTSRLRQTMSEKEINARSQSIRSVTKTLTQFSTSQSLSLSDTRSRGLLRRSYAKPLQAATNSGTPETPKSEIKDTSLKTKNIHDTSLPRSKMVTSSDSNVRAKLCYHRRRMSSLT